VKRAVAAPEAADRPDEAARPRRRLFRRRREGSPRPRRLPFDLKKALFILPNAFTVSSIFCGFWAIVTATSASSPDAFRQAGIALFFAGFFDAFDGRVARMTKTQSDFGVQIDSLADVISFGIAPAVLVHEWALRPLGLFGTVVSFAFAACGAIRLARFNVLAARGQGSSRYFTGLPIPGAAMMLISVIIAQSVWLQQDVTATSAVVVLVVVLSYLMVSRVRFRTFKDFRPSLKTAPIVLGVLVALAAAVVVLKASLALVFAVGAYIALGLVEEVVFFRKRRGQDRDDAAATQAAASS
jgi:CDP-diacylglycerol---serine O-phosphatidyltransferase